MVGKDLTIEQEFKNYFGSANAHVGAMIKHAFYNGIVMALYYWHDDPSEERLKSLAMQVDEYLAEHREDCDACREANVSLVRDWFGNGHD